MKILHWEFSPLFDTYYNKCLSIIDWDYQWFYTEILREPYKTQYDGAYDPLTRNIYLKRDMPLEKAEVVAAHELTHATKHYRYPAVQTLHNDEHWSYLGSVIQSSLQDVDVFQTLSKFGFDVTDELDGRFKSFFVNFYRDEDEEIIPLLAVWYVHRYFFFNTDKERWNMITEFYNRNQRSYQLGSRLLNVALETGFDTPDKAMSCLIDWVSILGLEGYILPGFPDSLRRWSNSQK